MAAPKETIQHLWLEAVEQHADRRLIVSDRDGSVFRYQEAAEVVSALCARFVDLGLKKGDTICLYSANNAESVFVFWAAMCLGIVLVPADHQYPRFQLAAVVAEVRPKLIFCDVARLPVASDSADRPLVVFDEPGAGTCEPRAPFFSDWLHEAAGTSFTPPTVRPDDTSLILYTSGTTSAPKGVELSHKGYFHSGALVNEAFGWQPDDLLLSLSEPRQVSGFRNAGVACVQAGCAFLATEEAIRQNFFEIAGRIGRHRCTLLNTSPALIRLFVEHGERLEKETLSTLRAVMCTGSRLSNATRTDFVDRYGVPLYNYYGLTETTGLCIANAAADGENPAGSLGRLLSGFRADVVDDDLRSLETGRVGELRLQSEYMMKGYYRDPALTATVIRDGWFYTGDLVSVDRAGHIIMMGRKKDIIKNARGALIHLSQVEAILALHPEVKEAGVCGYRSPFGDERMAAFLVPRDPNADPQALADALCGHAQEHLGAQRSPHLYRIVDELPRNARGKLQKDVLATRLGLDE